VCVKCCYYCKLYSNQSFNFVVHIWWENFRKSRNFGPDSKFWIPKSEFQCQNRNRNSDIEISTEIKIPISISKPKFWFWHRNQNRNFGKSKFRRNVFLMILSGLWIRIGSGFSDFVDPDPYWESGFRIQGQEN
jgi:hypothetical protein